MSEMDDLISGLATKFDVSGEKYNTAAPHPRFSSYKNQGRSLEDSQARRRNELIEQQKKQRLDRQMKARELALEEYEEEAEEMDTTGASARTYGYRKPSKDHRFKDQLMLSEWMVDVPEDLEENWTALLCPEGRRTLLVASKGSTKSYSKAGWIMNTFQSNLPGGNRNNKRGYTLLDCIFCEAESSFVVLDVLHWGQSTMDSDTAFRFFWLQSRMDEHPELKNLSKTNACRFFTAPTCVPNKKNLSELMSQTFPFQSKMDGVLFYLNEAHYWQGRTPLVLWLKPFMLPEMLDVSVPQEIMDGHQTQTAAQFRDQFDQEQKSKLEKRKEKAHHTSSP